MEKKLPSSQDAEEAALGSIIIDPAAIVEVSTILKPTDFYNWNRRTIFETIMELYRKHEPADFVTLCEVLERRPVSDEKSQARDLLDEIGGASYLTSLVNRVPTSGNAEHYARIVARKAELRTLIHEAGKIAAMAYAEEEDALTRAEEMILAIGRQRVKQDFESLPEYLPTYINHLEEKQQGKNKVRGISTGMKPLDQITGGLQRGRLYVIGARPGVGKTTICQNITYKTAIKHQRRVGFFSVEMSKDDLMDGFMSMHTKINSLKFQNGDFEAKEWERIVDAENEMNELGIYFEYTPGIYLDDLASMARRLVQRQEIDLLVIDYLQLIRARIDGKRIQPREMEIAEIARGLKMLAGELNIPILAPAQINRQVEHSAVIQDKTLGLSFRMPMLADLRESGEIEQSADVVGFLARAEEDETKVRLQLAKHRGGPKGDIDLYFEGETKRFMPLQTQIDEYGRIVE